MIVLLDCLFCIDGFTPAGIHPILGAVYIRCSLCVEDCLGCDGHGMFPAYTQCPYCFIEALAALGLTAECCAGCDGVVRVSWPEVT